MQVRLVRPPKMFIIFCVCQYKKHRRQGVVGATFIAIQLFCIQENKINMELHHYGGSHSDIPLYYGQNLRCGK